MSHDDRRERILDLWADGLTHEKIAAQLGITKNSSGGHVARARAAGDPRASVRGMPPELAASPRAAGRAWGGAAVVRQAQQRTEAPKPAPALVPAVPPRAPRAVSGSCQWPMWKDKERAPRPPLFCGAARDPYCRAPYCAAHARVARATAQDIAAIKAAA